MNDNSKNKKEKMPKRNAKGKFGRKKRVNEKIKLKSEKKRLK